ncbi:hypothetical protein [Streptomyces sp. V1I6]|uniref:hypothetical protein n=1 Tax=Streptomyces sp. V1I6 TaxID=3042273 RepID=UPI0027804471|nr:hypothetical protein [Streptomyces sp. V1I6]MDQ0845019.1 hypothetical protein [Streptomyces sp. V1I6]
MHQDPVELLGVALRAASHQVEGGAEELGGRGALLLPHPLRVPPAAPGPAAAQHPAVGPAAVQGSRQSLEQRTGDEVPQQLEQRAAVRLVPAAQPPQAAGEPGDLSVLGVAVVQQFPGTPFHQAAGGGRADDGAQQPVGGQSQPPGARRHRGVELEGDLLEQVERRLRRVGRRRRYAGVRGEPPLPAA